MTHNPGQTDDLNAQQRLNTRLLAFVLLYTVFAGALRKWVLFGGQASNLLLLGQILLPWFFYFAAPGRRERYLPVLLVFGGMLVLMALNPLNQTLYHGAFGVLLHGGFWLFAFHYLENKDLYRWDHLFGLMLAIVLIEVGLGIVQYGMPKDHIINRYSNESVTSIAFVGEAARVTGTFSFVAGFSSWLLLVNLWVWGLAVWRRQTVLVSALIAVSVVASLISGARMALALTLLFGLIAYWHLLRHVPLHRPVFVLLLALAAATTAFQSSAFLQQSWTNFASRIQDGLRDEEYGRRTIGAVEEIINYRGDYALLGTGLGGTYQGARLIWGESYHLLQYGGYEEEAERIVLEGGFVLLLTRAALLFFFLRRLRIPFFAKALFFALILFFAQTIFNAYNIVFFTFGLSILDWSYRQHETNPASG
ncbi:MAG: hypothetical protein ACKVU2_12045 [Saprospiraceae bacterium]